MNATKPISIPPQPTPTVEQAPNLSEQLQQLHTLILHLEQLNLKSNDHERINTISEIYQHAFDKAWEWGRNGDSQASEEIQDWFSALKQLFFDNEMQIARARIEKYVLEL